MPNYLRPDVYVERSSAGERPISAVGTSVGAFVGITRRGIVGTPLLITSWSDFLEKTALGLDTPFMANSDLAYAVYGFYQNGGGNAYISRVVGDSKAKASVTITALTFTALDEGEWANTKLTVTVETNSSNFDVKILYDGELVEFYESVTNTTTDENYYVNMINGISKYVTVATGTLVAGTGNMSGGASDIAGLSDAIYTTALSVFDAVEINLVAVSGQTSNAMLNAVTTYCENREDCFAILEVPMDKTPTEAITLRASINASDYGALYYPWIKVTDPLSPVGKSRLTPPSGHIMGLYARTDRLRGVYKAPAGEEAVLRGVVELEYKITKAHIELLNPKSINSIIAKPNIGTIVWGARTLSSNTLRRYVSDVRFDILVEVSAYNGTQWVVFEPNDESLWNDFKNTLDSFLYSLWTAGALKGVTSEEAFYVKCDEELNTQATINQGKVIAEIAYAKKKPAEFVIIKIVQKSV